MPIRSTRLLAVVALLATAACSASTAGRADTLPRPSSADSAGAHRAAEGFLAAFDSLNWEPFRAYFAEDITMFFPFPAVPARADGRAAVEAVFRPFFERGREAFARSNRTRQGLAPRDVRVQAFGDAAVVSFHLGAERPARRSIVFRRTSAGEWKVVHWHASSPPPQPASR